MDVEAIVISVAFAFLLGMGVGIWLCRWAFGQAVRDYLIKEGK